LQPQRYNIDVFLYIDSGLKIDRLQDGFSAPLVKYSEFLGIGYYGNEKEHVIAPIFDLRRSAERAWTRVMGNLSFHVVFVEHATKYEFIAYPAEIKPDRINYALYRSFSSLTSLHRFKSGYGGMTFIKFGWHDLTKPQKFDVLSKYAMVDSVEFRKKGEIDQGTLVDQIRKN
jgi:hypothetical protein